MSSRGISRLWAVGFAFAGLMTAACMLWVMGSFRLKLLRNILQISPTVPVGVVVILLSAWVLGGPFGSRIAVSSRWAAVCLGILLSLSCFLLGTIVGALVYLVTEWKSYNGADLFNVLVVGPLGVGMFGVIPASVLGIAYGLLLRRRLD